MEYIIPERISMTDPVGIPTRRIDRNQGVFVDRSMPDDRSIVAGFVVLMDDAGEFSAYVARNRPVDGSWIPPMPSDDVLLDITNLLATAWSIASVTTKED
jgi:hypothetical protein